MGWHKLRAKLSEYQNSSATDVEYLIINQVYLIFLEKASLISKHAPHQSRLDLTKPNDREQLFEATQAELNVLKSKISAHYHNLVNEIHDEIKTILTSRE